MGFSSCPWRDPALASTETHPQINSHRHPHLTTSFATFNTLGFPQLHCQGGALTSVTTPVLPSELCSLSFCPALPSPLPPCIPPSKARLRAAPPTCSRCQSRVSPSSLPPPHPSYTGSARTITGKHFATHPSSTPKPQSLSPGPAGLHLRDKPGPTRHRLSGGDLCGHFRGRPEHCWALSLPPSSQVKVNKNYLKKSCWESFGETKTPFVMQMITPNFPCFVRSGFKISFLLN